MEDSLREFLRGNGWLPQRNLHILTRRRFSARMIAARMGEAVILCEMARETDWPDYFERRRIRADIERHWREKASIREDSGAVDGARMPTASSPTSGTVEAGRTQGGAIGEADTGSSPVVLRPSESDTWRPREFIIFTDIAHSRHLWTWTQSAGTGFVRYVEFPLEAERLGRALNANQSEASLPLAGRSAACSRFLRDERELARSILSRFPGSVRRAGRAGLVDWCIRRAQPDELELLWEMLGRVRVIDPRCGSGEWLLGKGVWLEAVYTACLDRIRCHTFEPVEVVGRKRHAAWTALIYALETASHAEAGTAGMRHLRRRIVEWNLFGWDIDRHCVGRARRLLRDYVGSSSGELEVIPNIRLCSPVHGAGKANGKDRRTSVQDRHSTASDLSEELRSLEFVRKIALEISPGIESAAERRRSRREWEGRRRAVIRKRATLVEEYSGDPGERGRGTLDEGSGLWLNEDIRLVRRAARRELTRVK